AHAEKYMSWNVNPLVFGTNLRPTWLSDDRVWFRDQTPTGNEVILIDPATGARKRCDQSADRCGININDAAGGRGGRGGGRGGRGASARPPETMSPDGKLGAFIRDWNLWVRDAATGKETQLTTDGVTNFGYATDNAG